MKQVTEPIPASETKIKTKSNGGEIIMKNKNSYFKQILSVVLVVCMMAAFIPAVFATEEAETGVKVVYDFVNYEADTTLQSIKYADGCSNGRMEFHGESSDEKTDTVKSSAYTEISSENTVYLSLNINAVDRYSALRIRMPKNKTYNVAVNYVYANDNTMNAGVWILPANTTDIASAIKSNPCVTIDGDKNLGHRKNVLDTENGTFSSGEEEEYLLVFKRTDALVANQLRLYSVELSEINTSTGEVYETLETVPFYGTVSATSASLTDDAKSAALSVSNVYMSDGTAAPEGTDLSGVTYESSDESIIAIENGKAVAKGAGTATVSAYYGDLLLGSTEISAEASGEKILYSFDMGVDTMQEINYKNSHGRIAWHGTNSTRDQKITNSIYARLNLDDGRNKQYYYDAFKIRVPKNTTYNMNVTYLHETSGGPIMGVWILPADTTDIGTVVYNEGNPKPNVSIDTGSQISENTEKTVSGSFKSGEEEEYLLVFARTGTGLNRGLSIKSVQLSSGEIAGAIPFYGEVGFGDVTYLENKEDIADISIANTYMSDGTAAENIENVTYASSDDSVAMVAGTTVTAKGAGTATISAYSDGWCLGSADIDVAAVNEDGNPTTADESDKEEVNRSVQMLTTVLGDETASSSTPETVSIINGYATVTAPATDTNGNKFLYWAKGLQSGAGVKVLSTNPEEYKFKPSNGVNYIIAVYGKPSDEYTPKYFNANGQPLKNGDESVSMPGYGTTNKFTDCGFGVFIAEYDQENEEVYTITENNHGTENIHSKKFGDEVSVTAADASDGEYFRFWKKKAADGTVEIVSFDKTYTFYAFENCEVTAIYSAYAQETIAETFRKIILTNLDGTQFMAEFIGFGDAIEKGIAIGTNKISMTTDATQFTLDAETTEGVKGYAIDGEGNVYYAD